MKTDWLAIVNPVSGGKKAKKQCKAALEYLRLSGIPHQQLHTTHHRSAIDLTIKGIEDGFRKIIIMGGDGTVHEVTNGILQQQIVDPRDVRIAVVPIGTGNDWIKSLKIPANYKDAIALIKTGHIRQIDAGKITYMDTGVEKTAFCANMAGVGFDAEVVRTTNDAGPKGGTIFYLKGVLKTLFNFQPCRMKVRVDGQKEFEGEMFTVTAGIGKYEGGGMMMAPMAIPDDGWMDITVVRKISRLKVIFNILSIYDGSFVKLKEVEILRGRSITIESEKPIYVQAEGEILGQTPVSIEVVKNTLSVMVPLAT